MRDRSRIILYSIVFMGGVSTVAVLVSMTMLYNSALNQTRTQLTDTLNTHANLIEAIGRYDQSHSQNTDPESARQDTLSQIIDAHNNDTGFGETGEFAIATLKSDQFVFVLSHRHEDGLGATEERGAVSMNGTLAEPMRRALQGRTGTMVGPDYRGEMVLAAYRPVKMLNCGIVAKIDVAEIRYSVIRTGCTAILIVIVLTCLGVFLLLKPLLRRLEESSSQISSIIKTVVDPIVTVSGQGIIKSFNPAAEKLFDYAVEEVLGENIDMLMSSRFEENHDSYLTRFMESGEADSSIMSRTAKGKKRDGSIFTLLLSVSEVESPTLATTQHNRTFTVFFHDLTERNKRENDLILATEKAESLGAFGKIVDRSLNEIFIFETISLKIIHANHGAMENIGYTLEELHLMTPLDIKPEYTPETYAEELYPLLSGSQDSLEVTTVHRRKDGSEYPIKVRYETSVYQGRPVFIAVVLDITEQQKMDIALRESRERAIEADRMKSEFLANMSHEIRTPMTAILGYADLIPDHCDFSDSPEDCMDSVETIKRNGNFLLDLINDILDLSKIEAGKIEVEQIRCSPVLLVRDVHNLMKVRSQAKNFPLEVHFEGPIPESICTDPTRLRQILINVVGNAIKFTEDGSVKIVTRLLNQPGEEPQLQFDVIDTGMGIPEESRSKLFKPFMQADGSTTRKHGGTGLGLAISKALATLLGGEVTVSSAVDSGSTFSITVATGSLDGVPMIDQSDLSGTKKTVIKRSTTKDTMKNTDASLQNCRILFAEDGLDNQRLIGFILRKAGAEVTLAENGQISYDLATKAIADNNPYDVILTDMQMPVMDGYACTRKLRDEGYDGPIIAVTAHAMSSDRQKCLDAGCDDYTTKPVDRKKLIETIASYANKPKAHSPA